MFFAYMLNDFYLECAFRRLICHGANNASFERAVSLSFCQKIATVALAGNLIAVFCLLPGTLRPIAVHIAVDAFAVTQLDNTVLDTKAFV